ncbi:hypothetical protein DXW22_12455 [Salmonella enterica]|uniref:Uncharacterized protein n=1 Tax=Salmonella enterica TaxID=28901 RepID=A0A5T5YDA2_SALER|nr:hypothetical protein [Salmonella enterica]
MKNTDGSVVAGVPALKLKVIGPKEMKEPWPDEWLFEEDVPGTYVSGVIAPSVVGTYTFSLSGLEGFTKSVTLTVTKAVRR